MYRGRALPGFYGDAYRICQILKGSVRSIQPYRNIWNMLLNVDCGPRQVAAKIVAKAEAAAAVVRLGLGRIVTVYYRSFNLYQID